MNALDPGVSIIATEYKEIEMEPQPGQSPYKKIGMAATALFALMIIGFFAFVFYDKKFSQGHAPEGTAAEEVQTEAAVPAAHGDGHDPAKPAAEEDH